MIAILSLMKQPPLTLRLPATLTGAFSAQSSMTIVD